MLVLDTSQLEHTQPPDEPLLAMLKTIAVATGSAVFVELGSAFRG